MYKLKTSNRNEDRTNHGALKSPSLPQNKGSRGNNGRLKNVEEKSKSHYFHFPCGTKLIVHLYSDMISVWSVVILCNTAIHFTVTFLTSAYRRSQHTNDHEAVSEVSDASTQRFNTAAL